MTSLENLVLDGRYILRRRIAAGGMGEVWRGDDSILNRVVAVKVLRANLADDENFRERFRSEARITAGLTHPGIAQVFDYGEYQGLSYLVMELVEGEPLSTLIERAGPPSPEAFLDLLGQAARGMHAAHQAGIIHRDIKPGNLLITATGQVKITDFGIARCMEASSVTQTGTVLGTAQYVSPEQASGQPLSLATDIYSLGVVAYECLAGRPPFNAESPVAVALMHLREAPPSLPATVPRPVRDLILAMLAKDPADRPASGQQVSDRASALRDALLGGDMQALEHSTLSRETNGDNVVELAASEPEPERKRRAWTSMALVGAVGAVVFVVSVLVLGALRGEGEPTVEIKQANPSDLATPSATTTPTPSKTASPTPTRVAPPPARRTRSPGRPKPSVTRSNKPTKSPTASNSPTQPTGSPTKTPSSTPTPSPTREKT